MAPGFAVVNADIWTMEGPTTRTEAILVEHGKVVAVGEERRILAKAHHAGVQAADAGGRTVLPGLIDSHTHLVHQGLLRERIDLANTKSLPEALRTVRRHLLRHPRSKLVLAERWDESRWPQRRFPQRDELDAISTKVPIILRRVDGHIAVANRVACRLLRDRLKGVDETAGLLVEEASLNLNQVFPTPVPEATTALAGAQETALSLGVTTVHDFVVPSYLRAYQNLHARGRLRLRAHVSLYVEYLEPVLQSGFSAGLGDPRLRFHGVKLFADGSLGGHTAALREPYLDAPFSKGRLNFTDAGLLNVMRRAGEGGLHVSAHAIGDAAIDQVARAYQTVRPKGRRNRIEHYELHTPESMAILRREGIVASVQPNFVGAWSRPGGLYADRIGPRRARQSNEFAKLRRAGVRLAFGSDCMPFDPWFGLAGCVKAPFSSQRLPLPQAIHAYTAGSAWSLGREHDLGRLGPGAWADFILLGGPLGKGRDVGATKVDATYVGGALMHAGAGGALQASRGPWAKKRPT